MGVIGARGIAVSAVSRCRELKNVTLQDDQNAIRSPSPSIIFVIKSYDFLFTVLADLLKLFG
jgi:hypothetical protein